MEHFEGCRNSSCRAYYKNGMCNYRYGDRIPEEFRCEHLRNLLSREKSCNFDGWVHNIRLRGDNNE